MNANPPKFPRISRRARKPDLAVRFEYLNPKAQSVCVAGTFNAWHPAVSEMVNTGNGRWLKELALPPGRYEYLLVVDGEWLPDPNCPETAPNPFNGRNSVLQVPSQTGSQPQPSTL